MSGKRNHIVLSLNKKWNVIKRLNRGDSIRKVASDLGKSDCRIGDEIDPKLKSRYLKGIEIKKRQSMKASIKKLQRFTKDHDLRNRWVKATKRKGFVSTDKSTLCRIHVEENANETGGIRRRLKKDAVPKVFDFPSYLKTEPPKQRRIITSIKVQEPTGSNCLDFDEHHQNSVLSFHASTDDGDDINSDDESDTIIEDMCDLSESYYYRDNILHHINGFIVRKVTGICNVKSVVLCCTTSPKVHNAYSTFTSLSSMGHLVTVFSEFMKLVKYLYSLFLSNIDKPSFCSRKYVSRACTHFQGSLIQNYSLNSESSNVSHEIELIKLIGS